MISKLLALSFLLVINVVAQQTSADNNQTRKMTNGRFWVIIPAMEKTAFVAAALDTIRSIDLANGKVTPEDSSAYIYCPSLTIGEIQKELDAFFADAANAPIPIVRALAWVSSKSRGASREQLDIELSLLRKYSSQ
jgi:hypothetical protein